MESVNLSLLGYVEPFNTPELVPYFLKTLEYCVIDVFSDKMIIDSNNRRVAKGKLSECQV